MKFGSILGAAVALALVSVPVSAFQEQGKAIIAPPSSKPADAPAAGKGRAPAGLDLSAGTATAKRDEGTEVSIPGLGRLGVLPKMDFGLELLYGPSASPTEPAAKPQDVPLDDLTIRGSVKHNF